MEYTVKKLAKLAGVSSRTLRYYDEIGLLTPERTNESGYRIYGGKQVDELAQILFYRELSVPLSDIAEILQAPKEERILSLKRHLTAVEEERDRLTRLTAALRRTIRYEEEKETMRDEEKFECFKKKLVEENEKKYGKEVRKSYGDRAADESNAKMLKLSKEEYDRMQDLGEQILALIKEAAETGVPPEGETGEKLYRMHKEWLSFTWPSYSEEAHRGVAEMYVADGRFRRYYDAAAEGGAKFLRDSIVAALEK